MNFSEKLYLYAQLIVSHGLNVQEQQIVNISTEPVHRDFAMLISELSYQRGAKYVNVDLVDPRLARIRIENGTSLDYVPKYISVKYNDLVTEHAANLKIVGSEDPDLLEDLPTKNVNTVRVSLYQAIKPFYEEGIGKSQVHWTVVGAATPKWGKKIFPSLTPEQAQSQLWEEIFKMSRITSPEALLQWQKHNSALQKRAKELTALKIKELRFVGPETDLVVGLSTKAKFKGGSETGPYGAEFEPNIPTEEVFTTPDWRMTSGKAKTTRPFYINGKLIKGLSLEFTKGEITNFSAVEGEDTFREYISSDPGAKRLGEVALVGTDSPVFQSGVVFQEILFDENAACHIAIGSAYKFCLEGGEQMGNEDLLEVGCNSSSAHTDMMISSKDVDVMATTFNGQTITLLKNGAWVI